MLTMTADQRNSVIATCIRALPNEGCGLLVGTLEGTVHHVVPSPNVADSAKIFEIDSRLLLTTYRAAEDDAMAVIGVFHSHTHSDARPSPTDVAQAPDPSWHYVLVSLLEVVTEVRSYRIVEGVVSEEEIGT